MMYRLACEYSRFSLLLAARDVLPTSLAARCMQGVAAVFAGYIYTVHRPRAYMRQFTVDIHCGRSWRKDVIMNRVKSNVLVKKAYNKNFTS